MIHCADPADFWRPCPLLRARQLELNPQYCYHDRRGVPARDWMLSCRADLVRRWPNVRFVGAHLGGFPADLREFIDFLSLHSVDTSAALEELLAVDRVGAHRVFQMHARSIIWGSDLMVGPARSGCEAILVKVAAKYLRDSLCLITVGEVIHTPNPVECPWLVQGLALAGDTARHILYSNAAALFWEEA